MRYLSYIKLSALLVWVFVFIVMLTAEPAFSVPASPFPMNDTQPDGTQVEIFMRGDERGRWHETHDGYSLVKNNDTGYWEYALLAVRSIKIGGKEKYRLVLVPSGIIYRNGQELPEGFPKNLRPSVSELKLN